MPFREPCSRSTRLSATAEKTYIPDLWCYDAIIVELKAVRELTREHEAQLANYLHLTKCPLGLLVNFGSFPKATVRRWHRKDTP